VFGLKTKFRLLVGLAAFAALAFTALTPAVAAPEGSYSGIADGEALSLSISTGGSTVLSVDAGITHAELDSTKTAASSGAGLVQLPDTVAETDAPPDDSATAALIDQTIGDPSVGGLALGVLRGISTSEVTGDPTASAVGEVANVNLNVANLVGTNDWAVRSTSDVIVDGQSVTASAHSDEVLISLQLGDELVSPVCEVLGSLPLPLDLGEACQSAVDQVAPLTTVATVRILPADVECLYDGATETASVPVAQASLLSIQVFDAEPITVTPGQAIDLLEGTPLHIHADVGVATVTEEGNSASARAAGLELRLFEDVLPTVRLAASVVSCGVAGELPPEPPAVPRTPVTGGVLPPVVLGAAALMLVGLGARRFAKVS
jgi:hypothetical protein